MLVQKDELPLLAKKHGITLTHALKDSLRLAELFRDETDTYYINPYSQDQSDGGKIHPHKDMLKLLGPYPKVRELFDSALTKSQKQEYLRNALDDLRLSLELLLRQLFNNKKSLENQMPLIGTFQKSKNGSVELTSMFHRVLECYSKFQNENVKHNDNVNAREAELLLDLTAAFIKYLMT